jgi:tetratricopeptide (TPR) repeat protein
VYRLAVDPARYQAAFTHYVRGAALADSHPREGERELEESLRLVPDFPEVEERLAVLRMSEGRDAVPMLQSVVGRYPTALSAAINLALALRAKGDEKQARATLEQARATAVRIGPSAASYLPIIARLL